MPGYRNSVFPTEELSTKLASAVPTLPLALLPTRLRVTFRPYRSATDTLPTADSRENLPATFSGRISSALPVCTPNTTPPVGAAFVNSTFTLPTEEVYRQLALSGQRRAVLRPPYLEHLSTRFHYFQFRVALPGDHESE